MSKLSAGVCIVPWVPTFKPARLCTRDVELQLVSWSNRLEPIDGGLHDPLGGCYELLPAPGAEGFQPVVLVSLTLRCRDCPSADVESVVVELHVFLRAAWQASWEFPASCAGFENLKI